MPISQAYRLREVLPVKTPGWSTDLPVNWKSVRDVDNEGYHVPLAHPGPAGPVWSHLPRSLSGQWVVDVDRLVWRCAGQRVVGQTLRQDFPRKAGPAPHLQKAWTYYGLFPNIVFAMTPEGVQFYHDMPATEGMTRLTGRSYRLPNETRAQRLARYLAYRIDRATSVEDQQLSIWSNESMKSSRSRGFTCRTWNMACAVITTTCASVAGDDPGQGPARRPNRCATKNCLVRSVGRE
jgi:phenylpropionate dioxygenase-like ring-hydroxylating dioxygenase large terminal subunit